MQGVLDQYSSLFQEDLGTLKRRKVKFFFKEGAFQSRSVPLAIQQQVMAELDWLQIQGIIVPIKGSVVSCRVHARAPSRRASG